MSACDDKFWLDAKIGAKMKKKEKRLKIERKRKHLRATPFDLLFAKIKQTIVVAKSDERRKSIIFFLKLISKKKMKEKKKEEMSLPDVNFDASAFEWMRKRKGVKEVGLWKSLTREKNEIMEEEWRGRILFALFLIFFSILSAIFCVSQRIEFYKVFLGFIACLSPLIMFSCVNPKKYSLTASVFAFLGGLLFWVTYLILLLSHFVFQLK